MWLSRVFVFSFFYCTALQMVRKYYTRAEFVNGAGEPCDRCWTGIYPRSRPRQEGRCLFRL